MKKVIIFIISFVSFIAFYNCIKTYAGEVIPTSYGFWVLKRENSAYYDLHVMYYRFVEWKYPESGNLDDNLFFTGDQVHVGEFTTLQEAIEDGHNWVLEHPFGSRPVDDHSSIRVEFNTNVGAGYEYWVYNFPFRYYPPDTVIHDLSNPSEPDHVDSWFRNLWDFIMDTLGITDDFSNDLYDWVVEGEDGDGGHSAGHKFEYVTPTPSPTPTPAPTPTPYTLNIVDNNGNPVYTITGIPNQTITINNTTNNENGDDFDIFEVDVKLLPSGGVSNPKDGLNSVMDSNLEVLENIDVTPVGASFSVLPSDWFIMLGAIICMPFIAGFISKLLK